MKELERFVIQKPPDGIYEQPSTERVKLLSGEAPIDSFTAWSTTLNMWSHAKVIEMANPLVQHRCIVPLSDEHTLSKYQQDIQHQLGDDVRVWIPGGIPYRVNGDNFGLYYLHIADNERIQYQVQNDPSNMTHAEAVNRGMVGRGKPSKQLPTNISVATVADIEGRLVQVCGNAPIDLDEGHLIDALRWAHESSFAYPHDPNQRTESGIRNILTHNPITFAYDRKMERVAGAAFLEKDCTFTHGGIALVEPTYFTPSDYGRHGISSALRRANMELCAQSIPGFYGGKPVIIFNESIRGSSFGISLANRCSLPGGAIGRFDGDLGNTYTYIGPANPKTGLMPMGLTYTMNKSLKV